MNQFKGLVATFMVLGLSALLTPARSAAGQEPAARQNQPQVVRWRVEFADGTRAKLMAPIGETDRVTRQDGSMVAFQPLKDGKTGQVRLHVSEVVQDGQKKTETLRLLEAIPVNGDTSKSVSRIADFTVEIEGMGKPAAHSELSGIPLSNRIVRWEMTLSDGKVIRLAAREGEMARIRTQDGQSFGLVPVLRGDHLDRIEFRLFGVNKIKGAGESLHFLEAFGLEAGGEYFPAVWADRLIKVAKAESHEASVAAMAKLLDEPPMNIEGCCVTCGGARACGCSVSMDCGDCCTPPCCYEVF